MITQSFKHWLYKLFAWWPWRRSPATDYTRMAGNLNKGTTQEGLWQTRMDGPVPQPGTTSVAVEQGRGEQAPEENRPVLEERPDRRVPSQPSTAEENTTISPRASSVARETRVSTGETPSPTPEQQMAFLRYLVKHGYLNEGFAEGHIPDQYKKRT